MQEFDPSVSTITVTTSRINNRDVASLSVSKHFLERLLEFVEESLSIVAAIIPIGFPLCTLFNRYFAKIRAGMDKIEIKNDKILSMIPKYIVVGDAQACQMPNSIRLRPLVRDTIYQLIKARLKPKLIVEDSYEEARKLGIRIGLIRREHHKLAVIKSVDLLRNITDSRGDIKQAKVRYLLSRMKIMSQSTPADKSLLIYLMKHCESQPNENLAYLGYSFTDPEAMRLADCALTFYDCDDEDVKKVSQVILRSDTTSFTDLYLFIIICLLTSNITQSYALYQISASVSCCLYRFLAITVFQEQLISHSQFTLIVLIQQTFAITALMTKWLSSLPQAPLKTPVAEMSHAATEDSLVAATSSIQRHKHHRSNTSVSGNGYESSLSRANRRDLEHAHRRSELLQPTSSVIQMHKIGCIDGTLGSSSLESSLSSQEDEDEGDHSDLETNKKMPYRDRNKLSTGSGRHIHLSGIDLDQAVIDSKMVTTYKQTFQNNSIIDDVTYRLAKLHIAYQLLVMIIIMIFGELHPKMRPNNENLNPTERNGRTEL